MIVSILFFRLFIKMLKMLLFAIHEILIYQILLPVLYFVSSVYFVPFLLVSVGKDHNLLSFLLYDNDNGNGSIEEDEERMYHNITYEFVTIAFV